MATNVTVTKKKNETNISLLKRFGRKVQESGVIRKSKSLRYAERPKSKYTKKKGKIKLLKKVSEIQEKIKLGKMTPGKRGQK